MRRRTWGKCTFTDPEIPIFFIFGRDDPRQKGMDVVAESTRIILDELDSAYFVFAPLPSVKGLQSLNFLKKLAKNPSYSDYVRIFPFRMPFGYPELQASASFFIMPSFYEPFGGATEGYAVGTPVVARATGGLIQQIDPLNFDDLPLSIQELVLKYHGFERKPTGLLFREESSQSLAKLENDWRKIIEAPFLNKKPIGNPIKDRKKLQTYNNMILSANKAINQAITVYGNKAQYSNLIINGLRKLEDFSWNKTVSKYYNDLYFG